MGGENTMVLGSASAKDGASQIVKIGAFVCFALAAGLLIASLVGIGPSRAGANAGTPGALSLSIDPAR